MKEKTKNNTLATIAIIVILLLIVGGIILGTTKNNEYTVVFDSKGGTVVTSQTVKKGETLKEPEEPEKVGYSFLGWYESENSDVKYDFKSKVNKSFTLIAKWGVKQENTEVTKLSIISQKTEITVGEKLKLEINVVPENSVIDSKNIIWSSSDETIAKVDQNGNVVALKAGKVTITVKIGNVTNKFELVIKEKVEENNNETETNKNTNTQKPSNNNPDVNKPSTNNPSTSEPTTPSKPETPAEPDKPEEPAKPEVTYSYEWVKVETSVAGQYKLYIKSSEGKYVSGTATLTTIGGKSSTVSIPESGAIYVKDAIASVSNVKAN